MCLFLFFMYSIYIYADVLYIHMYAYDFHLSPDELA